ncbi:MAG: hypothetical protein AB7O31_16500 [Burkholderiales bacterium]
MGSEYYEAIDRMEKQKVDPEYVNGWASGYLRNPKREEQRVSEAYDTGYAHGLEKNTAGYEAWIRQ